MERQSQVKSFSGVTEALGKGVRGKGQKGGGGKEREGRMGTKKKGWFERGKRGAGHWGRWVAALSTQPTTTTTCIPLSPSLLLPFPPPPSSSPLRPVHNLCADFKRFIHDCLLCVRACVYSFFASMGER